MGDIWQAARANNVKRVKALLDGGTSPDATRWVRETLDDKTSLTIVMCVVFLGDTARGIFFPTLWTNVKNMGGDRITLGYCVGAFSFGRVMISPYFGNLSTKHGYRSVLMVASSLIAAGALAYALAWNKTALITAQVIMGVGSGTLGVTRAYVADKSTPEQRTYLLAYTTAVQYAGFTCMPFVGGLLSFLLGPRSIPLIGDILVLNQFTAPAFVMCIAAVFLFGLLYCVFKDSIPKPKKKGKPTSTSAALVYSDASAAKYLMGAPSDVSLALSNAGEEEEWPPAEFRKNGDASSGPSGLFMDMDSEDEEEARRTPANSAATRDAERGAVTLSDCHRSMNANGYTQVQNGDGEVEGGGGGGPPSVVNGVRGASEDGEGGGEGGGGHGGWRGWCRCCSMPSLPDMLIYGGFLLNMSTKGTIACFETLGAEYAMTHFSMTSAEAGSIFATFGSMGVVSLLSMRIICRFYNDVQIVLGGMAVMMVACILFIPAPTGAAGLPMFLWAVFLMYSVGYPIGHTAVLGLFSKVVGAQPQGTLLGWFGSAGSVARIAFPVIAGVISEKLGTSRLFLALVVVLCITVSVLFAFRHPYLECVETTKRRQSLPPPAAAVAEGGGTRGN